MNLTGPASGIDFNPPYSIARIIVNFGGKSTKPTGRVTIRRRVYIRCRRTVSCCKKNRRKSDRTAVSPAIKSDSIIPLKSWGRSPVGIRYVIGFFLTFDVLRLKPSQYQSEDKEDEENNEDHFGDAGGGLCNSRKPEYCGDDRDYQKYQSPCQHLTISFRGDSGFKNRIKSVQTELHLPGQPQVQPYRDRRDQEIQGYPAFRPVSTLLACFQDLPFRRKHRDRMRIPAMVERFPGTVSGLSCVHRFIYRPVRGI